MSNAPDTMLVTTAIRDAIAIDRLPWIRPLVRDHAERYAAVAPLFAGDPRDPAAWKSTIARVTGAGRDRNLLTQALTAQLEHRGAPGAARAAAASFADPATVAVVTGQQAGLFGGPLYSLLKAVTAIQLARRVREEYGTPAVPVFWVEAEDHDWEEVRSAAVLDRHFAVKTVTLPPVAGAGTQAVGSLVLDASIEQAIGTLEETLATTEFTTTILTALRHHYRVGAHVSTAFAGWLDDLAGRHGLVVYDASDPATKPAVADIFTRELQSAADTSRRVRQASAAMTALGHAAQLDLADDAVHLFYMDATGRRPIRRHRDGFVIGDTLRSEDELIAESSAHPERFSPNVVLRPVVQDRLFPTVCYVAGPAELAYQAQLRDVYPAFGVQRPLLYSRVSATILDSACSRFFERHDVPFESLQTQDESALNRLLEQQLPPAIDQLLRESQQYFSVQTDALRDAVVAVDPTLAGAVDTTASKIADTLTTLHGKIVQACKRKDETLRRQFLRTRSLTFPDGHPQERILNLAFFANRYGPDVADRLIDILPLDTGKHYLITL